MLRILIGPDIEDIREDAAVVESWDIDTRFDGEEEAPPLPGERHPHWANCARRRQTPSPAETMIRIHAGKTPRWCRRVRAVHAEPSVHGTTDRTRMPRFLSLH